MSPKRLRILLLHKGRPFGIAYLIKATVSELQKSRGFTEKKI